MRELKKGDKVAVILTEARELLDLNGRASRYRYIQGIKATALRCGNGLPYVRFLAKDVLQHGWTRRDPPLSEGQLVVLRFLYRDYAGDWIFELCEKGNE